MVADLLPHLILLPRSAKTLSKPKDTFMPEMTAAKGEDREKHDRTTM
jgi:hypothetical protein